MKLLIRTEEAANMSFRELGKPLNKALRYAISELNRVLNKLTAKYYVKRHYK